MTSKVLTLTAWLLACHTATQAAVIHPKDFGAQGDGHHIDSPAINAATGTTRSSGAKGCTT